MVTTPSRRLPRARTAPAARTARTSRTALAALVLAALAAGCDGSGSGADPQEPSSIVDPGRDDGDRGVEEVLTVLAPALVAGDGVQVCSLMSPAAQRRIESAFDASTCIDAVGPASRSLDADQQEVLGHDRTWGVSVDGESASADGSTAVTLAAALRADAITLSRVEGRWALG